MEKKIVVTGAAGFIGRHIAEHLMQKGLSVVLVDHQKAFEARAVFPGQITMDPIHFLMQPASFYQEIQAIIHMGAITDTTCRDEKALALWNTGYSKAVWKLCGQHQLGFLYASSASTYGDGAHGYEDQVEKVRLYHPLNRYAWSKQVFDLWVLEQTQMCPRFWSGWKFFNVYGPYEEHKKSMASVVTHATRQIQTTQKMCLFKSEKKGIADGQQKRDFVFVSDVVHVLEFALQQEVQGLFNLGSGQARSFLDLVGLVFQALKLPEHIEFIDLPVALQSSYQYFTEANLGRLRAAGYTAAMTPLEQGVPLTVASLGV